MLKSLTIFPLVLLILGLSACQPTVIFSSENPLRIATKTPTRQTQPAPFPSPTPTAARCSATTGTVEQAAVVSVLIYEPVKLNIYLPPCYGTDPGIRYPVLYMLHGQAYENDQWINLGLTRRADELISAGVIQPMVIVMPLEENWHPGPMESSFDEALVSDIIPYVESRYQVCVERSCRAIGGLSRGGNWAVYFGFAHPEVFTAVGAHSAPLFFGEPARIEASGLQHAAPGELPSFYIDVGKYDSEKDQVLDFVEMLEDLGVNYEFTQYEGRHDEDYWGAHVEDYLYFYSSQLEVISNPD